MNRSRATANPTALGVRAEPRQPLAAPPIQFVSRAFPDRNGARDGSRFPYPVSGSLFLIGSSERLRVGNPLRVGGRVLAARSINNLHQIPVHVARHRREDVTQFPPSVRSFRHAQNIGVGESDGYTKEGP